MYRASRCVWLVVLALALAGCANTASGKPAPSSSTSAVASTKSDQFTPTLTYSIPGDWVEVEDFASNFALAPVASNLAELEGETSDAIFVNKDVAASSRDCSSEAAAMSPEPDVGTTPQEMVDEFIARGSVTVSEPQDVTLDGLSGLVIDLTRNADWQGGDCQIEGFPDDPDLPMVLLYVGAGGLLHGFAPGVDTPKRYYLLAYGEGTVIVELQDAGADGYDEMESIVQTFSFRTS